VGPLCRTTGACLSLRSTACCPAPLPLGDWLVPRLRCAVACLRWRHGCAGERLVGTSAGKVIGACLSSGVRSAPVRTVGCDCGVAGIPFVIHTVPRAAFYYACLSRSLRLVVRNCALRLRGCALHFACDDAVRDGCGDAVLLRGGGAGGGRGGRRAAGKCASGRGSVRGVRHGRSYCDGAAVARHEFCGLLPRAGAASHGLACTDARPCDNKPWRVGALVALQGRQRARKVLGPRPQRRQREEERRRQPVPAASDSVPAASDSVPAASDSVPAASDSVPAAANACAAHAVPADACAAHAVPADACAAHAVPADTCAAHA
jgi:hypothetical protein